jgi:hypothetical protein
MSQAFTAIPFKAEGWPSNANGIAKFSSAGIVLEFESKFLGLFSNGVKEVRIGLGDIHGIRFKKGFLKRGAQIELRLNSMSQAAKLPNEQGKIVLKLLKEDNQSGREAVAKIEKDLAAYNASLPPSPASVSDLFIDEDSEKDTKRLDR